MNWITAYYFSVYFGAPFLGLLKGLCDTFLFRYNSTKTDRPRQPLLVGPHAALCKPAQGPAQLRPSLDQAVPPQFRQLLGMLSEFSSTLSRLPRCLDWRARGHDPQATMCRLVPRPSKAPERDRSIFSSAIDRRSYNKRLPPKFWNMDSSTSPDSRA
jgi:hypothetical protein